jgi:hypothetical protein
LLAQALIAEGGVDAGGGGGDGHGFKTGCRRGSPAPCAGHWLGIDDILAEVQTPDQLPERFNHPEVNRSWIAMVQSRALIAALA